MPKDTLMDLDDLCQSWRAALLLGLNRAYDLPVLCEFARRPANAIGSLRDVARELGCSPTVVSRTTLLLRPLGLVSVHPFRLSRVWRKRLEAFTGAPSNVFVNAVTNVHEVGVIGAHDVYVIRGIAEEGWDTAYKLAIYGSKRHWYLTERQIRECQAKAKAGKPVDVSSIHQDKELCVSAIDKSLARLREARVVTPAKLALVKGWEDRLLRMRPLV